MGFKLYENKGGRSSKPKASITTAGQIGLNAASVNKYLKDVEYIHLLYDEENKIIGIKKAKKDDSNIFKLTRSGEQGTSSIAGRSFLGFFEIDYSKSRKFIPEWDSKNEMLLIKIE